MNMLQRNQLFWVMLLLSSLGIMGCSTTKTTSSDSQRTIAEGSLVGLAAGLLTGKGDAKHAVVGAAVGTGVGALVANTKEDYKNQEDQIDKEIASLNEILHKLKVVNAGLKQDITSYRKQIAQLKKQVSVDASKKADLEAQKAVVDEKNDTVKKALGDVSDELKSQEDSYANTKASVRTKFEKAHLKVWQSKIASLKKEKAQLEQHSGQLQSLSNSLGS